MTDWLKKNRGMLLRMGGSAFSGLLMAWLIARNWEDISTALRQISAIDLLLAFGLILCSRLLTVARWYTLLRTGGIPISFKSAVSLTFTGLFANNFLPTTVGGDVVRLAGTIQLGYDQAICLASLAADRLVNMVGMSLAAPLGLVQLVPFGSAAPALALPGLLQKGVEFTRRTLKSLTIWLKKPSALAAAIGFALAHMLCMFSANYVLIHALGGTLAEWRVVGLFSLAYFLGLAPISINGYGWQELTISFLLSQFGGVDVSISTTVAIMHRLLMMTASLPGALTLPGILASIRKNEK